MLYPSPTPTLVAMIALPFIIIASLWFQRTVRESYRDVRRLLAKINGFLQENITGMETVQIFGREKQQYERYSDLTAQFRDANLRSVINFAIFVPSVEFLGSLAVVLLLYVGGLVMLDPAATLTFGTLVAFIQGIMFSSHPVADKFNIVRPRPPQSNIFNSGYHETIPVSNTFKNRLRTYRFLNVWFAYHEEEWVFENVSIIPGAA